MPIPSPTFGRRSPRRQSQKRKILEHRAMRPVSHLQSTENVHYYASRAGVLFEAITVPPSGKREGRVEILRYGPKGERSVAGEGFFQRIEESQSIHLWWVEKRSSFLKSKDPRFRIRDKGIDLARPVIDACMREAAKQGIHRVTLSASSSLESYYARFGFRTISKSREGVCSMVLEW